MQDRARATYEQIIQATGELLPEVGIERLSTNMIAERAGLTPPALYRYFPNKYAILSEMGRRLITAENETVEQWLRSDEFAICKPRSKASPRCSIACATWSWRILAARGSIAR
ncbi:helix-turn-helix domain-containing protein [Blastomonas sp. CCH5-A3]|uniref:TetR/AcrR family transcriptional regulator n=1 Tax=Blastomonas sp. CCH5-A3 TaxID=1768761 RepID=UPI000826EF96|nr:helix-turn-helix domain-containing protein [Blastomonas sp. CCH5-A3]